TTHHPKEAQYVGEAYAMVVAETDYQATDAAEAVLPELEPLPGVAGVLNAIAAGAPRVRSDMKSNVALSSPTSYGDINAAFGSDSVVASITLTTDRVAGAAMEPRSVTATPDPETSGVKLWTSTQNVFGVRGAVASALDLPEEKV